METLHSQEVIHKKCATDDGLLRVLLVRVGRADLMRLRLVVALLFLASQVHASEDAEERFFCPQWCLQRA